MKGFPASSAGKESTCNAGDPSSTPGSGGSPGEGIGYPLQYSWASLVAQLVKNPSAMRNDLGSIPGLGIPLQYSSLENSMDCIVHGVTKRRTQLSDFHWEVRASQVVKNLPVNAADERDLGSGRSSDIGNANPLPYSCLENSMGRRAWRATVHRLAKSQTQQSMNTSTGIHLATCDY